MNASIDALVTVTQLVVLQLEIHDISMNAPIDLASPISSIPTNLGVAQCMYLPKNEHGQCTINAWAS
jgi:hypothetical protein